MCCSQALAGHSPIRRVRARLSVSLDRPLPCEGNTRNYAPIRVHELFPRVIKTFQSRHPCRVFSVEPDILIAQLRKDEAITEADTLATIQQKDACIFLVWVSSKAGWI
jgi:hypothetical protein